VATNETIGRKNRDHCAEFEGETRAQDRTKSARAAKDLTYQPSSSLLCWMSFFTGHESGPCHRTNGELMHGNVQMHIRPGKGSDKAPVLYRRRYLELYNSFGLVLDPCMKRV
jgi:hypothetical protein